ncbi:MAG: SPOR domain-containing protein [Spirochaetaceae bacterium]|jgi:hypothetical protein|nr:SPOR domain-containing protein [Spirochaetaceae bacterium]
MFLSLFAAGYMFAAGSSDFPEASVAAYDADSGGAQIAIDWKKVPPDDARQFGLYRSTGEKAEVYVLLTPLVTGMTVYTDSALAVDTEYHYIIGGALPGKTLPETKPRKAKERRAESSHPRAAVSYGKAISGSSAWIPSEPPVGQTGTAPNQVTENTLPPPQTGGSQPYTPPATGSEVASTPPIQKSVFENSGVFFSMGYFSNRLFELTETANKPAVISLIDSGAKSRLVSLFNQSYGRSTLPGTSLYYAVHSAINRINGWDANGALSKFDTILLVTITDGLDTASTDSSFERIDGLSFKNIAAYQNFIKKTIEDKRIGGKKITAVSIGIQGTDTITEADYGAALRAAASTDHNVYRIPLRNLTKTLQDIAASATNGMTLQPFGFITPAYPDGTEIFIALDSFSTPARGQNFIAGKIITRGNQPYLENITLGGFAKGASSTASVAGRVEPNGGIEWQFTFSETLSSSKIVPYYRAGKDWQGTKEFVVRTYTPISSNRSVLVYLLIDNSVSMSNQNIAAIRESVTQFIDALSVNHANIQPLFSSNAALSMSRLRDQSPKPELAAASPQSERPPIPETPVSEKREDGKSEDARGTDTGPRQTPDLTQVFPSASVPQPVSGDKGYWVQASSSDDRTVADKITTLLRQYQFFPVITETRLQSKTFYRVRLGPYATLADASFVAELVKKPPLGFYDSFIP